MCFGEHIAETLLRTSVHEETVLCSQWLLTIDEFKSNKKVIEEKQIGLMGNDEITSTAILADQLQNMLISFQSEQSNLIQYTMAADRMSQFVAYLYQPYNPSILRLIKTIIDGAHKEGKWVGMCGEMAGEEQAIPLLIEWS
ncbi:hypothetical protein MNU24_01470 [Spiroplasma poulsonii]|nr:putative PEP-binding protein [Spiroplasma poulsonii]UNF62161.1 hypothetical protein MNU24_01470 [Spiroplasma poulsonii]